MQGRIMWRNMGWVLLLIGLAACQTAPPPNVPQVAVIPTLTDMPSPFPPTLTLPPTLTDTPTATWTASPTWTPIVIVATYTPSVTDTPSLTYTPSMTYTPSDTPTPTATFTRTPPPSFTPTEDRDGPQIVALGPSAGALVVPANPRCAPTTTTITAHVIAPVGLYTIRLNYLFNNGPGQVVPMRNTGEDLYTADLGPYSTPGVITYWVTAADNWGKWANSATQQITVSECTASEASATSASEAAAGTATAIALGTSLPGIPGVFSAIDVTLTTTYQTTASITLGARGGTPPYSIVINSYPANGAVLGVPPNVQYRPNNGFVGTDTFTFLAQDSARNSDIGVVRITVAQSSLTAPDQTITVPFQTAVNIALNPSGGTPPYSITYTQPSFGVLSGTPPNVVYTPNTGFVGQDSFTWTVYDAAPATDDGTITLNVVSGTLTGIIVFASDEASPGVYDIFRVNADGTGRVNLTNTPGVSEVDPDWMPDGRIVYASNAGGNYDIYLMNADGSGATGPLTASLADDRYPAGGSSGSTTYIAYAAWNGANYDIYRMLTDGSGGVALATSGDDEVNPTWARDGSQIAYQRGPNPGGPYHIWTMAQDGAGQAQRTNAGNNTDPVWSPTNDYLVFVSTRDGNDEIYSMLANGTNQTRLTYASGIDYGPTWSPDGSLILYNQFTGTTTQLMLMDFNGSNTQTLSFVTGMSMDWRTP